MSDSKEPNDAPVSASRSVFRGVIRWWPVGLVAVLLYVQWPMLKGMFLNAAGVEAEKSAIAWQTDFNAALAASGGSGKPLLVNFTASWCPPCQIMKRDVWPDDQVEQLANQYFIPVTMDVDLREVAPVADRYQVQAIPTIFVLDGQGKVLSKTSYQSRDGMIEFLKDASSSQKAE